MIVRLARSAWLLSALLALAGCGAGAKPAPPPTCDEARQDDVAVRGVRTAVRFAFDKVVSAMNVGPQDVTLPCLPNCESAGTVHIFGGASRTPIRAHRS